MQSYAFFAEYFNKLGVIRKIMPNKCYFLLDISVILQPKKDNYNYYLSNATEKNYLQMAALVGVDILHICV